jgi:hypothetical protein
VLVHLRLQVLHVLRGQPKHKLVQSE